MSKVNTLGKFPHPPCHPRPCPHRPHRPAPHRPRANRGRKWPAIAPTGHKKPRPATRARRGTHRGLTPEKRHKGRSAQAPDGHTEPKGRHDEITLFHRAPPCATVETARRALPCAGNPTMHERSAREHRRHVAHETPSRCVAGQSTTLRPAGVWVFAVASCGNRTHTGPAPVSARASACARSFADRFTVNPRAFAARMRSRFSALCLCVYVNPRRPLFASTRASNSPASMRSPSPGRSPDWLWRHRVPSGRAAMLAQKSDQAMPRERSDTARQWRPSGPPFA